MFANSFRRKSAGVELAARIFVIPLFVIFAALPTIGAGVLAWLFTSRGQLPQIVWILWGAFALTQLLNINLGQPGTTFDPTELIRFPMPLRRYVLVRLCFGLFSPANIIVSAISAAVAIGISIARPSLAVGGVLTMFVFALTNVLFTRMIFAWVDRWLSTRRAREVFTAFIFILSLSIQYLNVRFNPGFEQSHRRHAYTRNTHSVRPVQSWVHRVRPYVAWLPPELSANAIISAGQRRPVPFLLNNAGSACFGLIFLSIYTLRMRTEFRGENLSDVANATTSAATLRPRISPGPARAPALATAVSTNTGPIPSSLGPLLAKELLVLRRNVGLFYGLVAPAVMVFLFAGRLSNRNGSHWVLLGAVAYALLGISPMSYNSLGTEGTGAQLYFIAPVRLRDIFFAKNVFTTLVALVEVLIVIALINYVAGRPSLIDCIFALLWAFAALLLNTTVGNLRSVSAPKKIDPGKTMRKAQHPVSSYIAMGILAGCAAFGAAAEAIGIYLHRAWVGPAIMVAFALAAVIVYERGLRGIETYTLDRRDSLFEELGKKI